MRFHFVAPNSPSSFLPLNEGFLSNELPRAPAELLPAGRSPLAPPLPPASREPVDDDLLLLRSNSLFGASSLNALRAGRSASGVISLPKDGLRSSLPAPLLKFLFGPVSSDDLRGRFSSLENGLYSPLSYARFGRSSLDEERLSSLDDESPRSEYERFGFSSNDLDVFGRSPSSRLVYGRFGASSSELLLS